MPRRKKPIYRLRNLILLVIGLVFAFIGWQVYLGLTAKPGASVNYAEKTAALIESQQPPGSSSDPDGYVILANAITILGRVEADIRGRTGTVVDYTVLRGEVSPRGYQKGELAKTQAATREALAALSKSEIYSLLAQGAASRRAVRPTPEGKLIEMLLPALGRYRQIARLNGTRMFLAHESGDDAEVARAFEQTLALGRIAGTGSFLIEELVGIAINALALGEVRTELVERPMSEQAMLDMLAAIDRQPLPNISFAMRGEQLSTLDTIQWTHTDDGRGSGRLIPSSVGQLGVSLGNPGFAGAISEWRILNVGGAFFPSKAANIKKTNEFYDMVIAAAGQPFHARTKSPKDLDDFVETLSQRYLVLRILVPAVGKAISSGDQYEMMREATRTMLALEIFNKRNGRYPASLSELAPSVLSAVPLDPFTGQPFGYRLLTDDANKRPYLLYSFGADKTDDGGKMRDANKDEFLALRPIAGKGFDVVMNSPRWKPGPEDMEEQNAAPEAPAPAPTEAAPPARSASPAPSGT